MKSEQGFLKQIPIQLVRAEAEIAPKVIIPESIWKKISWLCANEAAREWSAIVWYSEVIEDEQNVMTVEDLFLMDIGTQGHTGFNYDSSVVEYTRDKFHLMTMKHGLCHSHNTMPTFFSGEDDRELIDNTVAMGTSGSYLSIIVNNKGEVIARTCFYDEVRTEVKRTSLLYPSFAQETSTVEEKIVWYYNCIVEVPRNQSFFEDEFYKRYDAMKLASKKSVQQTQEHKSNWLPAHREQGEQLHFPNFQTFEDVEDSVAARIMTGDKSGDLEKAVDDIYAQRFMQGYLEDFKEEVTLNIDEFIFLEVYTPAAIAQSIDETYQFENTKFSMIGRAYRSAVNQFLKEGSNNKRSTTNGKRY